MSVAQLGDLRYICISQNIGAIDPSEQGVTSDGIKRNIHRFVVSMGAFLRSLAADMHARTSSRRENNAANSESSEAFSPDSAARMSGTENKFDAFDVVVLHMQEIGGKKRNEGVMSMLGEAVPLIYPTAGWCSGLLMATRDCSETFTAMGTVIFVSQRIAKITSILSFKRNRTFVAVEDDPVSYVSTTVDGRDETQKDLLFAGKKFSDAGTSRKGYMLSSIRIGSQILNFVNLHMFHDDDNRVAVKTSPSEYVLRRTKAWGELIAEILPLINPKDPCFVFGDLNTRLDGLHLMEFARNNFSLAQISAKKNIERNESFWDFVIQPKHVDQLLKFDRELPTLLNIAGQQGIEFAELPIQFPPTFTKEVGVLEIDGQPSSLKPYSQMDATTGRYVLERITRPNKNERFPAFCDRILFNPEGLRLISGQYASNNGQVSKPNVWKVYQYNSTVFDSTDHDCVYLAF